VALLSSAQDFYFQLLSPDDLPLVRHDLSEWLAALGLPDDKDNDVLLVASELVNDAVAHNDSGPMSVRAWAYEGGLSLEVVTVDAGRGEALGLHEQPFVAAWRHRIIEGIASECSRTTEGIRRAVRCKFSV
jgi:hypothetical protein